MTDYVTEYEPPRVEFLDRYSGEALSLLRIVTALLFLEHGTGKLLGFPMTSMAFPPVWSLYWAAGWLELVGSVMLVLGLFTRTVAFVLAGEMAIAYWYIHAPLSSFPMVNHGEAAVLFCFIFLMIAATGPGPWSVDAAMKRRQALGDEVLVEREAVG